MIKKFQHRIFFLSVWFTGAVALFFFPGWEAKGFIFGLIAGFWPFLFFKSEFPNFVLFASVMIALSGLKVGLCAWAMDKAGLTRIAWLVVLIAVMAGVGVGFNYQHDRFGDFQAMWLYGEPTRWDFYPQPSHSVGLKMD
jgi:hypothetical protein